MNTFAPKLLNIKPLKKLVFISLVSLCIFTGATKAQTYTDLYDFNYQVGENPWGGLLAFSGNTLYGTTFWGGSYHIGVVFSVNTNGGGYTVLQNCNNESGYYPVGSLTLSGNILYGMTNNGGTYDYGVIYSLNTNGSGYTVLHNFNDTLGEEPWGSLTLSGNTLYGMTPYGGGIR
jgi:uncharacterized repeat protein (TIGR03803 family)